MAGTYGVHALGGPLFDDGDSRLYVLDVDTNLYEADPLSLALSPVLATGPALMNGDPRHRPRRPAHRVRHRLPAGLTPLASPRKRNLQIHFCGHTPTEPSPWLSSR